MKKQDIVVHIKDEAMLQEAREILESAGEEIDEDWFFLSLEEDNYLYKSNHDFGWALCHKDNETEITLQELKQLLNEK